MQRLLRYALLATALLLVNTNMMSEGLLKIRTLSGTAYSKIDGEGGTEVYVCERLDDVEFYTDAPAQWYEYTDKATPLGGGSFNSFQRVEDGVTYLVTANGDSTFFAVLDYRLYRIAEKPISADLQCTVNSLKEVKPMIYHTWDYRSCNIPRQFTVSYITLQADSTEWVQTEMTDTVSIAANSTIYLDHLLYLPTTIDIRGDQFAELFYGDYDLVRIEQDDIQPVAIGFIPKSYTTLRGTERENEIERVIKEDVLTGSAPMNVLFRANATPTAEVFLWEIKRSEELIASRSDNQTRYIFDETGKYSVSLHVSNTYGCECDTVFQVDAKESRLEVPNVFTPNGDGINDEFRVAYRSLKSYSCYIFNRWQHQIYSSNDPAQGWNGRVNGRPAPEGAYYYIIEAVGTDGVKYKRKGAVNLLRGKKD